jgi:prepilin-type N-terminal cleavage/methylation domain-containing protein
MRNKPPRAATIRARGFSLLEVILALAILAGAIAVLGEVIHLAREHAADCQTKTRAQILAATLMDEIAAGLREITEQDHEPLETDDLTPWVYTISLPDIEIDLEDLVAVEVVVEQDLETPFQPAKMRLLRWFHTPDRQEETANSEASPSTSGGNSD